MTASLALFDGLIGAPGLSWSTETTSGLYRAGAGDFRYSIASTDKLQITTNGVRTADGAAATPAYSFIADPDTGIWRSGANILDFATGGTNRLELTTTTFALAVTFLAQDGAAATPGISFNADPDTGIWRSGANLIDFTTGGTNRMELASTGLTMAVPLLVQDGLVATPSITFAADTDTGFYRTGGGTVGYTSNGVLKTFFDAAVNISDGLVGSPSLTFISDPDTGLYHSAANEISVSTGGTAKVIIGTSAVQIPSLPIYGPDGVVGAPGYTFNSDTDTGLFRQGANDFRATTGGTARMIWTDTINYSRVPFQTSAGAVGAPSFSFEGDPDTGFFNDTANQIAIALGGASGGQIAQTTSTGTFTGCTTAPTTTLRLVRVGNHVICSIDAQTATSNAGTFTLTGAIPALYQPARNQLCPVYLTDNSNNLLGMALISSGSTTLNFTGVFSGAGGAIAAFTAAGVKGINGGTVLSWQMT
jgi:hypothetical protein